MTTTNLPEQLHAFFDPNSPTSVANRAPKKIADKLLELCMRDPNAWEYLADEEALCAYLYKHHQFKPSVVDNRIRLAFYQELEDAINTGSTMVIHRVHALSCTETAFNNMFLKSVPRALYLACRPESYELVLSETLAHGMKQLRRILDMEEREGGKLNTKLLELKVKIYAMLDLRKHGSPTQRIETKGLQINANVGSLTSVPGTNQESLAALMARGDLKAIQNRISAIEHENKKVQGAVMEADTVEVEVVRRE
jgi:hypothetical protein